MFDVISRRPLTLSIVIAAALVGMLIWTSTTLSSPLPHARMLMSAERLAELRAAACYDSNGNQLGGCTPTVHWSDFISNVTFCMSNSCSAVRTGGKSFALAYLVTQNTAYRTKAIEAVTDEITNGLSGEHGQQMLDANRIVDSAAFVYDWLYNDLSADQRNLMMGYLNRVVQEIYFQHAGSSNPQVNPYFTHGQWGVSDETNNYFYAHLVVAAYAGVATYGDNDFKVPVDITNPSCSFYTNRGGCPTNTMDLYMSGSSPNHFSDIMSFVYAKLDREGVPYLNTYGAGGGWQEGNQYGAGNFSWAALLMQQAGFRDFLAESPYGREKVQFFLYSLQPGKDMLHPLGDAGREKTFATSPYEREDMLILAAGLAGQAESRYAQYYLNHVQTSIPSGWQQSLFKNFLLQDPGLPETNYANELATLYHAPGLGWINSRSSWADDAVSVSFISTDHIATAHQHKDQNSFDLYRGDGSVSGWQMGDANTCDGSNGIGDSENTKFHNSLLVNGSGQFRYYNTPIPSYGDIVHAGSGTGYHYVAGEAANAYLDTNNNQRTLSRFTREIMHILPGYVVMYDRITPTASYQSSVMTELFQYKGNPTINGNTLSHTSGGGKIFQTVLAPSANYSLQPVQNSFSWSGTDHPSSCYRVELETTTPQPDYRFLNLFEVTSSGQAQAQPSTAVASTNQLWEGAFINGAQRALALFSKNGTPLAVPLSYSYTPSGSGETKHYLANVASETPYEILVNGQSIGTVESSSEGILAFGATTEAISTTITITEGVDEEDVTPPGPIGDLLAE